MSFEQSLEIECRLDDVFRLIRTGRFSTPMLAEEVSIPTISRCVNALRLRGHDIRADVFATVKTVLDDLPHIYTPEIYQEKCDLVYRHVFDAYQGGGRVFMRSREGTDIGCSGATWARAE